MNPYPHLFSPLKIGDKTAKNRISCSPQSIAGSHEGGRLTQRGFDYYLEKARGGAGIVTLGETQVLSDFFQKPDSEEITKYHLLTDMIRNYGAISSIELGHRGCEDHVFEAGAHVEGPSGGVKEPFGVIIDEITPQRMEVLADAYADACQVCLDCGFDMVMIHGGHSWLLAQFLSPLFNHRTDAYGGSPENRARFPLMVLRRIRERVGKRLLLDYRLSAEEVLEEGLHLPEAVEFCKMIEPYVDLIHASVGTHIDPWCYTFTSIYHPNGINLPLAQAIKEAVSVPVVAIGGFNTPEQCDQAIAEGRADIICLGRQMLADPHFPRKAQQGRGEEINTCIRCMGCHSAPPPPTYCNCTVNPTGGKEYIARQDVRLHGRVVVVGGGVAGMTAACRASDSGAEVILLEASDRLGGVLWFTDHDVWKKDLKQLRDNLVARTLRRPIEVRLNTTATPELLQELQGDFVLCAVGAQPVKPGIPGLETAIPALDSYAMAPEALGDRVVIVGGGLVGCELAMHLTAIGKHVTVVEMGSELAPEGYRMSRDWLLQRLVQRVRCLTSCRCIAIEAQGIWVEMEGAQRFLAADSVIYALGMRARTETAAGLRSAVNCGFAAVGDCVQPGKVKDAIHQGWFSIDLMR